MTRPLTSILLALAVAAAPAAASQPDELKAAIVYNIIRFTRFVRQPTGRITMCVLAGPATARAFGQLDGKPVPDGHLSVRSIGHVNELRGGCTIAFVQGEDRATLPNDIVMTIGDNAQFANHGGTVGLRSFGRQITFEINAEAGSQKGVRFSARLLNLASVVYGR